ncbi:MAG: penicillin-binding protein 2 [Alphaproteobacteria bacterium]|nr:penicillin-binding protein 2 [Alphaproteobacteria bacterium]
MTLAVAQVISLTGDRSSALYIARGRLVLIGALFALAFFLLAVRAVDVTVMQALPQTETAAPVPAVQGAPLVRRAAILDRNGVLLATSVKAASLYADPTLIADPKGAAHKIVQIFPDLRIQDIMRSLTAPGRFHWIKRHITPAQQAAVLRIGEPGLAFAEDYRRIYPQGALAGHLLGYTNVDGRGLAGFERAFDDTLAQGQDSVRLSLDTRLQHALRREIENTMRQFNAKAGIGTILDANTGEVLAGVSLPDYDPNHVARADKDAVFNRLSLGVYELGSIFKIFSTAALLDKMSDALSMEFDARQPIQHGRFSIKDYHPQNRALSVPEVFMYSSNIGSALMGQAVGTKRLRTFYERLGLLTPMTFESREIARPLVPSPWRDIDTLTAAYGHGLATTPLQTAAAVASIVNGGTLVRPTLLAGGSAYGQGERIVSAQTAAHMRSLLRLVVTDGTGAKADVPGYWIGGKTGTAEKAQGGAYNHDRLLSSFIGIFPAHAPRYVVLIAIDEPRGNAQSHFYATGGWVAAPAVGRVVAAMGAILGLPPQNSDALKDPAQSMRAYISANAATQGVHDE